MAIRINNSNFAIRNGSFRSSEFLGPGLGVLIRLVGLNADSGSYSYQKINYAFEEVQLNISSSISYRLALSGSATSNDSAVSNFISGNQLMAITNLRITGSTIGSTFTEELITTAGAGTWTKPAGVTQVIVECWGGGGAGGGATSNPAAGGGGGGGQYSRKYITYTSPSVGISYSVGAGGVGTTGTIVNGGDTTWQTNVVIAKGGTGGTPDGVDAGGVPGGVGNQAGSVGDVIYFGTDGEAGTVIGGTTPLGGIGGSGAASTNNGPEYAGVGGAQVGATSLPGNPGSLYGGGGSGACTNVSTNRAGGNGARGLIRIIYRIPQPILQLDAENPASYPGTGTVWNDLSGIGNNATMTGSVSFVNTSPKYFDYTNTPNYFIGNSNLTSSISNAITIISWIKVTDITKRSTIFDKYQTPANPNGYGFEVGTASGLWTNTVRFFAVGSTGNGWDPRGVSNAIQQNVPCMVSVTLDSSAQQSSLYVNGSSISFTQGGGTLSQLGADWAAGANNYSIGSIRPEAAIDSSMQQYKLTVYNTLLTATQIASIYNQEKSLYGL